VPTRRARKTKSLDAWKDSPLGKALQFAGITPGELTDRMGGAYVEVIDIADRQLELRSLPLETAKLIANALNIPLAELPRFDEDDTPTQDELEGSPGRTLIAILSGAQHPLNIERVAEQLDWDPEFLRAAISTANSQLTEAGFFVALDETDSMSLERQDSSELQALAHTVRRQSSERSGGGIPELDSCAVNFALMDLSRGDVGGFNNGRLSSDQLEGLVDEDVIEPYGDSYWLTPRTIEFLDLGIPTAQQLDGVDPTNWTEVSAQLHEQSIFGVPKSGLRSVRS
jgi:hypothetical protein